jgi:hypothetical protein
MTKVTNEKLMKKLEEIEKKMPKNAGALAYFVLFVGVIGVWGSLFVSGDLRIGMIACGATMVFFAAGNWNWPVK